MCFPYGKCLDKIESFVEKTFTLLQNSRPRCHKQRSLSRTQKCRKIQQGRRANTLLHWTNTNLSVHELLLASPTRREESSGARGGGGRYFLIWSIRGIRGCDAGQGLVLVLSVLNRVYNFARVFPKQCAGFVRVCSNYKQGVSCTIDFVLVGSCPKQCTTIEGVVLNRVCILGIFCPKQGYKPLAAHLYPNISLVPPSPPGKKGFI